MPTMSQPAQSGPTNWIQVDPSAFRRDVNQRTFGLTHSLDSHPSFALPKLMELAERTLESRPGDLRYDLGDIKVDQRWENVPERKLSAMQALQNIEKAGAWLVLFNANADPEYRPMIDQTLGQIKAAMGGNIQSQISKEEIIIFISSPRRVTPYHIDRECNFLLQIQGTKTVYVFDRDDRDILTEEELERYWTVTDKQPTYRKELQNRAVAYKFAPGNGCHIPVNCPHWVENDDNVSVSVSINFQYKDRLRADAYRANYLLRRIGLTPTPPGRSRLADTMKSLVAPPATRAAIRMMEWRHKSKANT